MSSSIIQIADAKQDFKLVFNTYFKPLCFFANRLINDEDLAKDLVQDVFIKIWRTNNKYISEKTFKAYLYLATRNICLDHLKQKNKHNHTSLTNNLESAESINITNEIIKEDVYSFLEGIINKLPDKAREIIWLNMNGLSNIEIANELNVSVNTIKTHKRTAYKKIRELYGDAYLILLLVLIESLKM